MHTTSCKVKTYVKPYYKSGRGVTCIADCEHDQYSVKFNQTCDGVLFIFTSNHDYNLVPEQPKYQKREMTWLPFQQ